MRDAPNVRAYHLLQVVTQGLIGEQQALWSAEASSWRGWSGGR
jgi:hypothetical protein